MLNGNNAVPQTAATIKRVQLTAQAQNKAGDPTLISGGARAPSPASARMKHGTLEVTNKTIAKRFKLSDIKHFIVKLTLY